VRIEGRVEAGGAALANSNITMWAAGVVEPRQLAQTKSGRDGRFALTANEPSTEASVYLVAKGGEAAVSKARGDNPAIALLAVLGSKPSTTVTINELKTVAAVITHNQYIDGTDSVSKDQLPAANAPPSDARLRTVMS
jgi:hypothetical protein